ATSSLAGGKTLADYVILADEDARDLNDGFYGVTLGKELRYLLHVPKTATYADRVPLLIWLNDDGFSAAEGMTLWKERLGNEVAIAVIEPPYPETQADLQVGGRWFWPETFPGDVGALSSGIESIWGYLLRNERIDPERVVLAGEGTGGTVVTSTSLFAGQVGAATLAVRPRHFRKLRDFALPLRLDG
ncbi:MAG: hypothetical protein GY953_48425, partial [bacterium]|nr:hypothetical protein [bacterium]